MEKLRVTYNILQTYKQSYEEYKAKVKSYFKNGDAKEWEFFSDKKIK